MSMSEKDFEEAFNKCETQEEREALIRSTGEMFKAEGQGVMDAETLEIILQFCDVAVQTVLISIAKGLAHPDSTIREIDATMMGELAANPPPVVRESVFSMIDMMGLTVGDPDADPTMTDAALTAILDGKA